MRCNQSTIGVHLKAYRLVVVVILTVLCWVVIQINSVVRTSATYDEPEHVEFGMQILTGRAVESSMQKMPVTALNALPLLVTGNTGSIYDFNNTSALLLARLPTLFMGAAILLLVFFWSNKLFGLKGALASLLSATFCPNLAAHAGLATTDIPCALAIALTLSAFIKFNKDKTWSALIIAALVTGLAQLTKSTALILIPLGCCVIACTDFYNIFLKNMTALLARIINAFVGIGLFLVIILLCINAGYGFYRSFEPVSTYVEYYEQFVESDKQPLQTNNAIASKLMSFPVPLPFVFVETIIVGVKYNKEVEGHGPIYLLGELNRNGFWYYFPIIFLLKVPIPLIILTICASFTVYLRKHRIGMFLVTFAWLYFILFSVGCTAQIGFRYLLPIMPLLYVAIGVLPDACSRYGRIGKGMLISSFAWLIMSSMSYYPHWLSYVNEFVLDRKKSYLYFADSNLDWGQNDLYLRRYLEKHPFTKIAPPYPTHGEVIISVNDYLGINSDSQQYNWLSKNYRPVDTLVYSWLIFSIPE